jgi:DNA repair exonuclease SbcCD ATPase subunit
MWCETCGVDHGASTCPQIRLAEAKERIAELEQTQKRLMRERVRLAGLAEKAEVKIEELHQKLLSHAQQEHPHEYGELVEVLRREETLKAKVKALQTNNAAMEKIRNSALEQYEAETGKTGALTRERDSLQAKVKELVGRLEKRIKKHVATTHWCRDECPICKETRAVLAMVKELLPSEELSTSPSKEADDAAQKQR